MLVVDDESAICDLFRDGLEEEGFRVVCAGSDADAYRLLDTVRFEALVLDVNLGEGTTGFDVARYARRHAPAIPVVFATGGAQHQVERFGVAGARTAAKPCTAAEVAAMLRDLIGVAGPKVRTEPKSFSDAKGRS